MTTENQTHRPSHRLFQIEDRGESRKPYWREVGVAWTNKDGSLNLDFAVLPLIGSHTVQARVYDENEAAAEAGSAPRKGGKTK